MVVPIHIHHLLYRVLGAAALGVPQDGIEDISPSACLELSPGKRGEIPYSQLLPSPDTGRAEPAADVVPLQIQRVVQVKH
jgi:hypothetical protein